MYSKVKMEERKGGGGRERGTERLAGPSGGKKGGEWRK